MTMVEYLIPCLGEGRTCKFFSGSWDLTPSLGMPVMHCITVIDSDSRVVSPTKFIIVWGMRAK